MSTFSNRTRTTCPAALPAARGMGADRAGIACRQAAVLKNMPTRPD